MATMDFSHARAVAEVDTKALSHNFRVLQHACTTRQIAVVKADAYGHSLSLAVPALLAAGCDFFAVATCEEGIAVRALAPTADVLVLGYLPLSQLKEAVAARLILTVFSAEQARALSHAARELALTPRVHLKIDTGMHRLGLLCEKNAIRPLFSLPNLQICGVFTHFPTADIDPAATRRSLTKFLALRRELPAPLFAHAAASAAALTLPEAHLDATRQGIALYGYPPVKTALPLRPTLRVIAPVVQIRELAAGERVGYGGEFVAPRCTRIGTVPLGYADGILRTLTGFSPTVLCDGVRYRAPIVGRVCMDYLMLDLTAIPAKSGQTVCVFEDFDAAARHAGTIPYELLTAISARVPRAGRGEL